MVQMGSSKQLLFYIVAGLVIIPADLYAQNTSQASQFKSFAAQSAGPEMIQASSVAQSEMPKSSIEGMLEKPIMQQRSGLPSSELSPNELAVQLIFQGDKVQGLQQLELAHQGDPTNSTVLFNLAGYYLSEKDYLSALSSIDKALAISPDDLQFLKRRGDCLLPLKKFSEAAETYKKITQLSPEQGEAFCKLGALYGLLGRWQESEESLMQARTLVEDEPSLLNNLASARLMMKKYKEAIEVLELAQQRWPTSDREITLGVACEGLGDRQLALSHYENAKRLGTSNKHIEINIERVRK